jgi:hypothetical protein
VSLRAHWDPFHTIDICLIHIMEMLDMSMMPIPVITFQSVRADRFRSPMSWATSSVR